MALDFERFREALEDTGAEHVVKVKVDATDVVVNFTHETARALIESCHFATHEWWALALCALTRTGHRYFLFRFDGAGIFETGGCLDDGSLHG